MAGPIITWRPDPSASYILTHEAIAHFLDTIAFKLYNALNGTTILGETIFIDMLPKEYYDENAAYGNDPNILLTLVENEPIGIFNFNTRFIQKVDSIVKITVYGGSRTRVAEAVRRLYVFFLQRENASGWAACGLSVHFAAAIQEPTLIGVEDSGLNAYQFRVQLRAVRTDMGVVNG